VAEHAGLGLTICLLISVQNIFVEVENGVSVYNGLKTYFPVPKAKRSRIFSYYQQNLIPEAPIVF